MANFEDEARAMVGLQSRSRGRLVLDPAPEKSVQRKRSASRDLP